MTVEFEKFQKRLDNKLNGFAGKFMSDSKWTKLFKALSQNHDIIEKCLIKDVFDDIMREIEIPDIQNFEETFHENGINDVMIGGPSFFKQIEWIEFPSHWTIERNMRLQNLEPFKFQQDISAIKTIIDIVGQFELELDDDKLIIYGYKL